MQKKSIGKLLSMFSICLVLATLIYGYVFTRQGDMTSTFWGLVPPIIAIVLALVTKEVYSSLFIGICAGALFSTAYQPIAALDVVVNDGLIASIGDSWNAGIFIFLVMLGILVALINLSGGSAAFGRWAEQNIKSRTGAMFATFILGVLIFVDDYFNCLTVGSVMRPITDRQHVSRAKLAYLIDATAAPVCMIAPISSWAAAVSSVASDLGTYTGIELFIRAIPYNFYSLLTLAFVLLTIFMNVDYGPMRLHEMNAQLNNDIFTDHPMDAEEEANTKQGKVLDLVLPILVLIVSCILGMLYVGGFFGGETFVDAFANTDASMALPWGSLIALLFTMLYLILRKALTFQEAMECIPKGFIAMVPAILVLTFALTLKGVTNQLDASGFVAAAMAGTADSLARFLPAVVFLVACGMAFATGTSWGTFGILIPIVVNVFRDTPDLMIIAISACLAGAVCGDHCSPISDTTIMSSAGAACFHVNHVNTQLPYAGTVAVASFICYIFTAFVQNAVIAIAFGVALLFLFLLMMKKRQAKAC